jgi:hypothetical protein
VAPRRQLTETLYSRWPLRESRATPCHRHYIFADGRRGGADTTARRRRPSTARGSPRRRFVTSASGTCWQELYHPLARVARVVGRQFARKHGVATDRSGHCTRLTDTNISTTRSSHERPGGPARPFLSPDNVQDPYDSQSLNRYSTSETTAGPPGPDGLFSTGTLRRITQRQCYQVSRRIRSVKRRAVDFGSRHDHYQRWTLHPPIPAAWSVLAPLVEWRRSLFGSERRKPLVALDATLYARRCLVEICGRPRCGCSVPDARYDHHCRRTDPCRRGRSLTRAA